MDAFDLIDIESPEVKKKYTRNEGKGDAFDQVPGEQESFGKASFRTASQIPQGVLATTPPGILAGLWHMLAQGEVLDPEEIERLEQIAQREGVPFDKEAYLKAAEEAVSYVPSVTNIARGVEKKTGVPLEPKTRLDKALRFATEATRLVPQDSTIRGLNTALPRPVVGAAVEGVREGLLEAGIPEPVADIASFAVVKMPTVELNSLGDVTKGPDLTSKIEIGKSKKPSGLTERRFENLVEPIEVPASRIEKINTKLEKDFREISDKIIKESPVGETAENLKNDPTFKQQSRELLDQAQEIADVLPGKILSNDLKKEYADTATKQFKGFAASEYDKSYAKFMKEAQKDVVGTEVTPGKLVEQFRKNNRALDEYFEPGSSRALNRAKRDALLDQNKAITNLMEKSFPESELVPVFKEGNARWTRIKDAEEIDNFINDIFKEKLDYKKVNEFFDDRNYGRIFKRALGEEGFKQFEQLMKDMLTSAKPYSMLKVAKDKGWTNLFNTAFAYVIHPKIGAAKHGIDLSKAGYKAFLNALLDKPKMSITYTRAVNDLKKGKFAEAEKGFESIKGIVEEGPLPPVKKGKAGETIEVEPIKETKQQELELPEKQVEFKEPKPEPKTPKKPILPKKEAQKKFKEKLSEKPKKKTKVEALEEAKQVVEENISKRKKQVEEADPRFKEERKKQLEAAEKRKSDIQESIDELKSLEKPPQETYKTPAAEAKKNVQRKRELRQKIQEKPKGRDYHLTHEGDAEFRKGEVENSKQWYEYFKDKHERTSYGPGLEKQRNKIRDLLSEINNSLEFGDMTKPLRSSKVKSEIIELGKHFGEKIKYIDRPKKTTSTPMNNEEIIVKLKTDKKPASTLTESKIKEVKTNDISKQGLKKQKEFILDRVNDALENPSKYKNQEKIDLSVPGDGEFRIHNNEKALQAFKKKVQKEWPDKPLTKSRTEDLMMPSDRRAQRKRVYP